MKKKQTKKLVLLDAHAIIHRAYHALPDFSTKAGEPTGGLYGVSAMLIKIINELKPDYIVACYDLPEPTFRHDAYDEYKAGRQKADEALVSQINRSRDIFTAFNIPIYEKAGFEADDILGTIANKMKKEAVDIVIASGDMDTLQLVDKDKVCVYTLRKGLSDTVVYNEKAVMERFGFAPALLADFKGLRGDPSDNIIGIAGIGEKTATTLIQNFGTIEDIYKKLKSDESAFENTGIKPRIINLLKEGEEDARFSKTLATIVTDVPVEFSLPQTRWSESLDFQKIEKLFSELEFRTLLTRVKSMMGDSADADVDAADTSADNSDVSEEDILSTGVAMWVLDSDATTPSLDDILQKTGETSFVKARMRILEDLKKENLLKVYEDIELPLMSIIKSAQDRGVLVDVKYLDKLSKEYHKKLQDLEKKIWGFAGVEFNINSPKQMAEVLFDQMNLNVKGLKKTAAGKRSTRESELLKLEDEHEIIKEILSYRELQKLLSTYIDNIPNMLDSDNRLHSTLNQAGTTTGRFSSTNPNMQNIPTKGDLGKFVRNAFMSTDGYNLIALDYSQIEMRVLAVLSKDETLIDVFKRGEDVHATVASHVFGVKEEDVTKDMRRKAKVINFGIVYGMGVNALRANLGGTRAEAQEFYNNYFEKFPTIAKYFETVKSEALKKGFTETMFGRRRHFKGLNSSVPFVRASAERQVVNAPIQGTAADIIKIAMKRAHDAIVSEGLDKDAYLLLQVHDELIYEVEDDSVEKVKGVLKEAMEHAVEFAVPLTINVSVGKRWGDLKNS